jgi:hypothetical protein
MNDIQDIDGNTPLILCAQLWIIEKDTFAKKELLRIFELLLRFGPHITIKIGGLFSLSLLGHLSVCNFRKHFPSWKDRIIFEFL